MGGGETSNAQILPSHTLNHVTPTPQASAVRHLGYWHHYSIPVGKFIVYDKYILFSSASNKTVIFLLIHAVIPIDSEHLLSLPVPIDNASMSHAPQSAMSRKMLKAFNSLMYTMMRQIRVTNSIPADSTTIIASFQRPSALRKSLIGFWCNQTW